MEQLDRDERLTSVWVSGVFTTLSLVGMAIFLYIFNYSYYFLAPPYIVLCTVSGFYMAKDQKRLEKHYEVQAFSSDFQVLAKEDHLSVIKSTVWFSLVQLFWFTLSTYGYLIERQELTAQKGHVISTYENAKRLSSEAKSAADNGEYMEAITDSQKALEEIGTCEKDIEEIKSLREELIETQNKWRAKLIKKNLSAAESAAQEEDLEKSVENAKKAFKLAQEIVETLSYEESKNDYQDLIEQAQKAILLRTKQWIQTILSEARTAAADDDYERAIELATQVTNEASEKRTEELPSIKHSENVEPTFDDLYNQAREAIFDWSLKKIESHLDEAESVADEGDYRQAADMAKSVAEIAPQLVEPIDGEEFDWDSYNSLCDQAEEYRTDWERQWLVTRINNVQSQDLADYEQAKTEFEEILTALSETEALRGRELELLKEEAYVAYAQMLKNHAEQSLATGKEYAADGEHEAALEEFKEVAFEIDATLDNIHEWNIEEVDEINQIQEDLSHRYLHSRIASTESQMKIGIRQFNSGKYEAARDTLTETIEFAEQILSETEDGAEKDQLMHLLNIAEDNADAAHRAELGVGDATPQIHELEDSLISATAVTADEFLDDEIAEIEEEQRRQELEHKLDSLRSKLDDTNDLIQDGSYDEAQAKVDSLASKIRSAKRRARRNEFDDLQMKIEALEDQWQTITEKTPIQLKSNNIPDATPEAPNVSVKYNDLTDEEPIGGGGNADVTKAALPTSAGDVTLAIKEPRMAGTLQMDAIKQILDEAETWDKLDDHDHIVSVLDFGDSPIPWIAMEYMDGGHLGSMSGDLNMSQALWTAITITKGVRHAHRRGVAHLDLKPENVLFRCVEDGWDVPKVADWGLSKHLLNHSKSVEGLSPQYAAPEQFGDGYGPANDITDIYQLGAVFYELFTGQPPFDGKPAKAMHKVLHEEPTNPSEIADVPEALDDILLTALAKEKHDRYDDILYLRDELQELFGNW